MGYGGCGSAQDGVDDGFLGGAGTSVQMRTHFFGQS
jgi:hypothetical protein